jgi:gluconate 2-dehydrogenase gamma chain
MMVPVPGEAGVVYFIDRALNTFGADQRDLYRHGLEAVHQARRTLFPQSESIDALSAAQQAELMHAIETTPFFEALRTHSVIGFLGSPAYGGNRGGIAWAYIGFEDRMMFQPPFGYYDAEATGDVK